MSLFWDNFISNGKSKNPINDLRESLAEVCEDFVTRPGLSERRRRAILHRELKNLAKHYRDWDAGRKNSSSG